MSGEMIKVQSRDGFELDAYHVEPAGDRKGGVIVVQEVFGLSDHIKAMADMFGDAGFEVIAPSMYDRARPGFIVQPADVAAHMEEAIKLAVGNGPDNAMSDVGACFDVMSKSGPVFITGFCYGGSMSWLAAHQIDGVKAASCYYGGNIPDMAGLAPKCEVICHFGKKDTFIPNEKVAIITEKNPDVKVYWYDADHGFARKDSYSYDEASAKLAHERTLELFTKNV
jgi:carboxymethylenebutenolidase